MLRSWNRSHISRCESFFLLKGQSVKYFYVFACKREEKGRKMKFKKLYCICDMFSAACLCIYYFVLFSEAY